MRLWSLHPSHLDQIGLVAQWREGLLAKKVLEGKTKGYRNHPQLLRFKACKNPIGSINAFLHEICDEADRRDYKFDRTKLARRNSKIHKIPVTKGQMDYEWSHLMKKLFKRSRKEYFRNKKLTGYKPNPLFKIKPGEIESWEIIN